MKKVWKALDILCETLFFLVITYTLSSMYTSFKTQWYAILFLAANIFAIGKYHSRIIRITGSKTAGMIALVGCLAAFIYLAYAVGYITGEFTPFQTLW